MILDALPAHVALLDSQGTIIAVNRAWREFARLNLLGGNAGVGENYLAVCERSFRSGVPEVEGISVGIRDVLTGHCELFEQEYSCHSPDEQRCFRLTVSAIRGEGPAGAVVTST
jgi:PAS domain-containing protein